MHDSPEEPGETAAKTEPTEICDRFLPTMPRRSVAVVRPDRILMHQGPAERAPQLVNECLALLGN